MDELLPEGFIKFRGVCLRASHKEYIDVIEDFQIRDDDVWVTGFPKTGTTWTREMVWCIGNDLDYERAKLDLKGRFLWLESQAMYNWEELSRKHPELNVPKYLTKSIECINELPSPRFIISHLPFHILPRDLRERKRRAKIIYITRDPKDAAISFFNFQRNAYGKKETFEEYCEMYLKDQVSFCPFWDHVLGYLKAKNDFGDQMMIIKYSDMKANIRAVIGEVSKFLGKPTLSPEDLEKLVDHLSFEKMKKNPAVNWDEWLEYQNMWNNHKRTDGFMRSGQVGEWKSVMPQEIAKKFDKRTVSVFALMNFTF